MCKRDNLELRKQYSLSGDVYGAYWAAYEQGFERKLELEGKHYVAVNRSLYCRTASQGRVVYRCGSCGNGHEMYKSCKHRFCEKCGVVETYRWGSSLRGKLMNIKHCHITFTLPKDLRVLAKSNGNAVYNLMFAGIVGVLSWWFLAKYGVKCGVVMVLHTSGSDLKYHPHIHCIVSCGGIKTDLESGAKGLFVVEGDYLVSHGYLGEQFRKRLSGLLGASCESGNLCDKWGEVLSSAGLEAILRKARVRKSWIVGVEKGLRNVEQIIGYVGRYTKRACISVYKIAKIGEGVIAFKYNDYANTPRGEKPVVGIKEQRMGCFFDSLLQHVPNKGFQGVRYGGVYANACQKHIPKGFLSAVEAESEGNKLLELGEGTEVEQYECYRKNQVKLYGKDPFMCSCGTKMSFVGMYIDGKRIFGKIKGVKVKDTS